MKKIVLIFGLLLITNYSFAQCQKGDCKNGFSIMKYSDAIFEGNYADGKFDGLGLMYYNDKRFYQGEYKGNNFNGFGHYKWKTGEVYFGRWKNGVQTGLGIQKAANGGIQSAGIWAKGENPNPLNSTSPTNNPKNCDGNCIDGVGDITDKDSVRFIGVFKDTKIVFGRIIKKEYDYEGEIKNNIPNGYGQIRYSDSNEYFMGYFKEGKKHGTGIYTNNKNNKTSGNWINDEYQDPSIFEFSKKDFCAEIISLAKLNKKERHSLKVKEKNSSNITLEKQFLNQFTLKSESYADNFLGKEKIYFYFPERKEDKPTIGYEELIDACKSCKKLIPTKDSYFQYNDAELYVSKYSSTMTMTFPKPDPCVSGNCKNGKGKKRFEKSVYEGPFKNGLRHGKGKEVWNNGNSYEGEFMNDQSDGKGVFLWKDGAKYEGEFSNGFREGTGTYTYASGSKHVGGNKKSMFSGYGKKYNKDGKMFYEGNFENSKYNGQGTLYYTDGYKYVGAFKKGKLNGFGIKYNKEGNKHYQGNYKDDKAHGKGVFYYIDGGKAIEGNFENGNIKGQGTQFYTEGKYIGTFKENIPNGAGKYYNLKGILTYEGQYKDGKTHGKGISYFTTGKIAYEGNYENGKRNGQGIKYYTDGKYVGEFKDNLRQGAGKFYNLEGQLTFEGHYKDDKPVK